jgi:hypothetical protein
MVRAIAVKRARDNTQILALPNLDDLLQSSHDLRGCLACMRGEQVKKEISQILVGRLELENESRADRFVLKLGKK